MSFEEFRESERVGWSERAEEYDSATARATLQSIPALLAALQPFHGAKLLDAGCGPGYVSGAASAIGANTIGIDFSAGMVAAARKRFPGLDFRVGDVEKLDFADGSFDCVASNIVLLHVTDPMQAMRESYRVLKPGGTFAFSQWAAPANSPLYRDLMTIVSKHADLSKAEAAPDAFELSNPEIVAKRVESLGFENVRQTDVQNVLRTEAPYFFDFFMIFGVRVPLILMAQEQDVYEQIRNEVNRHFEKYRTDGEIRVAMPSIVFSGQRPR